MKEYKVVKVSLKESEKVMNDMAHQGWEVVSVCYMNEWVRTLIITFSKEI